VQKWCRLNTTPPVVNRTNYDCWGWHPGLTRQRRRRLAPASVRRRLDRAAQPVQPSTARPTPRRGSRAVSSAPVAAAVLVDRRGASVAAAAVVVPSAEPSWRQWSWLPPLSCLTSSAGRRTSYHICGLSGTPTHRTKVRLSLVYIVWNDVNWKKNIIFVKCTVLLTHSF